MAALTTIALLASAAVSGFEAITGATRKAPKAPAPPVVAPAPTAADEANAQEAMLSARKGKAIVPGTPSGSAASLLTGPSGLAAAPTQSKTLLGL